MRPDEDSPYMLLVAAVRRQRKRLEQIDERPAGHGRRPTAQGRPVGQFPP